MSKKEIKVEGKLELPVVLDYVGSLMEGMKEGRILIKKGMEELVLEPEGSIEMKVEAKQKKDEEKFEISLKWKKDFIKGEDLKISSK